MSDLEVNKTVIITGASSFVGMHLCANFAKKGWTVVAVHRQPIDSYQGIRFARLEHIAKDVQFRQCDLLKDQDVKNLIETTSPRLWIQHAATTENYHSRDYDLAASLAVNVLSLLSLYQNLSATDCGVILTGTSMEYTSGITSHKEDDACWPDMPYGVSKLTAALEAHRLAVEYNVPTRIARLFMPVGTFDTPGRLIETIIQKLNAGENVDLTTCDQIRDFLGVDDISAAYLVLADDLKRQLFDVFNICSSKQITLRNLVLQISEIMGADARRLNFGAIPSRPNEQKILCGNNTKAKALLNWHPKPIEHALKMLIAHAS